MEFTGERFVPTEQGRIRLEHYHRYVSVMEFVADKDVLDVACGEGYGTSLMATAARSVVGVDISEEAIDHASRTYNNMINLSFRQGSATSIPAGDAVFDVVVSFETIEHLSAQAEMLAELRRVLRPDGILIISSPNRPVYSAEHGQENEFHVKELDFDEFDDLLKSQFASIRYFGQRMLMGSVIQPLTDVSDVFRVWHDDGSSVEPGMGQLSDPVYFLAICASSNVDLPSSAISMLYPDTMDLVKHYIGFAQWAKSLERIVADRDVEISRLEKEVTGHESYILRLKGELDAERAKYETIVRSSSWRVTTPLRELRRWTRQPKQQADRYAAIAFRTAKKAYRALPIGPQTRANHRNVIARWFPRALVLSGSPSGTVPSVSICRPIQVLDVPDAPSIAVQSHTFPVVSVIIPAYGKVDYTLRCLASIAADPPSAPYEVIVVDDCSPDDTADLLEQVRGIRLIKNEANLGFIRSCNRGATEARGEYLLFLNNDTQVEPGWLDELLRTFSEFPGTGLAGSKLVYPDGRLQEAGGIIWQDGSAWNFGRFQDPSLPVYNYAREVDYCSGASIMVPRTLFVDLGGFDEHYAPAYCEDSDLALKVRSEGYRVIYQPLSTVIHFEGVTSGTDTAKGVKSYQVQNSAKLFARWKIRLEAHQGAGLELDNAKDRRAKYRVLVIDHCTPTPNQDAGSVTVLNLLLLLREMDFQVTFIPEDNFLYMPGYTEALQRAGIEVLYAPHVVSVEAHLKDAGPRYDLAFLFRPSVVERHLKTIRKLCSNAKVLYHTVDLHFLRISREAELEANQGKRKAAHEMRHREITAIRRADASIIHSPAELEILRPLVPDASLHVFPLIMDVRRTVKGFDDRRDIAFVGGYQHTPNVDAVKYFVAEIMPELRKRVPGIRFFAVGSNPPPEILALEASDVIVTGFVEDLTALLDRMRVSVAPLRFGAGIKGKIGSAMAVGLPVVATSIAVEGMSLIDGDNVLVADDPVDFANAVARVYHDSHFWAQLSNNGLDFAEKSWGAESAWKRLASILVGLGFEVQRGHHALSLYTEQYSAGNGEPNATGLSPIASVKTKSEFQKALLSADLRKIEVIEQGLIDAATSDVFTVQGTCVPCNAAVRFLVDMESGGRYVGGRATPNWRERLECPTCRMNNRQRLVAALVKQELSDKPAQHVYFMEQVTPIFRWANEVFGARHRITGSEYLGPQFSSGQTVKGVRHEDVENLSFSDLELNLIVSNDVFEHVPNPAKAFTECARVLADGGLLLATIPFHVEYEASIVRAEIVDGSIEHRLPPAYHGNPVSDLGSLVFTDFGWDVIGTMKEAGFAEVSVELYASAECGHLGGAQLVFRARKRSGH